MAKMAKGGFSRAAIEEKQFLIKQPRAKVQEEKNWGVEFPGHKDVKAALERHRAMLRDNLTDGCLPCQNGTEQNPQTRWRRKGTGAPPPQRLRQLTPEPMPQPPETPFVPPGNDEAALLSKIERVPPGDVYIHTSHPSTPFFCHDAYAKNRKRDKDFYPDLLTDEGTSTG